MVSLFTDQHNIASMMCKNMRYVLNGKEINKIVEDLIEIKKIPILLL
jgi:hypothetical protein